MAERTRIGNRRGATMAARRSSGLGLAKLWGKAREPVFVLNRFARLVFVNAAWEELTGRSAESVRGLRCRPRAKFDDPALAELAQCFRPPRATFQGRPARASALITRTTGEQAPRHLEFWPFHDREGTLAGILGLALEVPSGLHDQPDAQAERARAELEAVRARLLASREPEQLVGQGPAFEKLLAQVHLAAETRTPALILGEPGTGKRSVAQAIHRLSPQAAEPFLPFDASALPPDVLEQELFDGDALRIARGSVLLLDALTIPRDLQARLARIWDRTAPCRLLAIGTGDPAALLAEGQLREDYFHRLTAFSIPLPPLRRRWEEIPLLAQHLLERQNRAGGRTVGGFGAEALAVLQGYDWPGNLRELSSVVDHARRHGASDPIAPADLPRNIQGDLGAAYLPPAEPEAPLEERLARAERDWIERTLRQARGNKSRAAESLGISRPRLYRRMRELEIPDPNEAADPEGDRRTREEQP
jgi:transcriptional regulator with PAS, ATPase and Fis domain